MRISQLLTTAVTAAVVATPATVSMAAAQQRGSVELGGFLNAAYFDRSLDFDQGEVGIGGLVGYFVTPKVALEGEIARVPFSSVDGIDANFVPLRARATYNAPLGANSALLLGAGYVHTFYRHDIDMDDDGATALVGLRVAMQQALQLRFGTYLDFIPSPSNGDDSNINWGVTAGISYIFGHKKAAVDTDRDGVPDTSDKCPGTPASTVVNPDGCASSQLDTDRDGVNDSIDRCPDATRDDQVDPNGCAVPKDADGDKVIDANDACPGTPAGATVDDRGCASSQRDADKDGVNDSADRCADTPANTAVDASGCPLPVDSDKDGVTDDRDRCPNTAAGTPVDSYGCHAMPVEPRQAVTLKGVTFESGKSALTADAQAILQGVAQSLVANPELRVEVQGHTDNTGGRALNVRLSKARAAAVRQFLIDKGVDAKRLTAKGYGPDKPATSNDTPEGRAENRRVALERLP